MIAKNEYPRTEEILQVAGMLKTITVEQIKELEREDAALRQDKDLLDWILTHKGGSWLYWQIENGQWTPGELGASREAIDAARKEAQP